MFENGLDKCSCTNKKCKRNSVCGECLKFHKARGSLTRCQRDPKSKSFVKE